jgi:D-proline reductase (dithiol) PrdB
MRRALHQLLSKLYTRIPAWPGVYARLAARTAPGAVPWTPATVPLERATVALVTTAGLHLRSQAPFDMQSGEGDASYRVIPATARPAELAITHDYYDHAAADRDPDVVFPLSRLREFAATGRIGRVAPRHIGAMGHILGPEERRLVTQSAPAIAHLLQQDGVDYVVLVPG